MDSSPYHEEEWEEENVMAGAGCDGCLGRRRRAGKRSREGGKEGKSGWSRLLRSAGGGGGGGGCVDGSQKIEPKAAGASAGLAGQTNERKSA